MTVTQIRRINLRTMSDADIRGHIAYAKFVADPDPRIGYCPGRYWHKVVADYTAELDRRQVAHAGPTTTLDLPPARRHNPIVRVR